jgi:hypothetical protein
MIDWLRRENQEPVIVIAGRTVPIELRRHGRAKRLTLRLAPDGSAVRITLPAWCRSAEAIAFAHARCEWLANQLAKVPQPRRPANDGKLRYCGGDLLLDWSEDFPRRPVHSGQSLTVGGPYATLDKRLQRWLEAEALRLFKEDARAYCERSKLETAEVKLTRALRRWGSCSSHGTLRLNWRLVQAPDAVRRSVVAHEVAHLVHFDHSPAFHALLGNLYEDDLTKANQWLSRHGRELYASFG